MKYLKYTMILIVTVALSACHTTKKIAEKPQVIEKPEVKIASTAQVVSNLQLNQPRFNTANISKMSINIQFKEREYRVAGACQMIGDSAIYLSIMPALGLELFRLELTPTDFIVIDKFNKRFYKHSYDFFKTNFGVDLSYYDIQALLSNQLFLLGKQNYTSSDFKWKENNPARHTLIYTSGNVSQEVVTDSLQMKNIVQMMFKTADGNNQFVTNYFNLQQTGEVMFPKQYQIYAEQGGIKKAMFDFNIEKITFNEPLKLKPANLSKYTQGDINTLFKK